MTVVLEKSNKRNSSENQKKEPKKKLNKLFIGRLFNSIDKLIKESIFIFLIIGFLSHYNLIENHTFLANRLNEKIYKTKEEQLFSIGNNCYTVIGKFLLFINWGYVSIIFILLIGVFVLSNTLLYYFPGFLLHRFMCFLYICIMFMNLISVFPMWLYILSPGFFAVLYFIIRVREHQLEDYVKKSIQETFIFHTKEFFILFSAVIFFLVPFIVSMLYFLYNLLLNILLFNNKANISNLSNIILSFIILKIITCFVKYFITFMQHHLVKEKCFNWNSFRRSITKAISKTYEYCFFLIICKILTDVVIRILLFDFFVNVKLSPLLYLLLITLSLIQISISIHKSVCMSITLIWEKFPGMFSFYNPKSKRRFYTGRNVMFYFRALKNDLFTKVLWNIESRVALFHGALLNIIYFIFTNFLVEFEQKLIKNPNQLSSSAVNNIPIEIFNNELCLLYKRNIIRFFLVSPYLFLLICTQTTLISTIIFQSWYFFIKES